MGSSNDDDDDKPWNPMVLSVNHPAVRKAVKASLDEAKAMNVPGAAKAKVTVERVSAVKVTITGIDRKRAATLGRDHLEPAIRKLRGVLVRR